MKSEEKNKSRFKINFTILYIIGFLISFFFEFYWMTYYPYDYFMLFGIGVILCIFGYLALDGIYHYIHKTVTRIEEQNEIIIKSQKAIYLTAKKIAQSDNATLEKTQPQQTSSAQSNPQLDSLIGDLIKANERLAREVEDAASIHSLTQNNIKLAETLQNMSSTAEAVPAATEEELPSAQEEIPPVAEETENVASSSDKNGTLSPEEVAAMFANL